MSALKRFYNLIFGIKPEVKKKRRVSKPSEKPKAVYDLLNSVGAIDDLNGTHGTEFSSEWVKDKEKWRKFFNKNKEYLIAQAQNINTGRYYKSHAIIQVPSVENEIKEKAEKDLGFEVSVNQETAGVYVVSRSGLPLFDGPNLITDSTTLVKDGFEEAGEVNRMPKGVYQVSKLISSPELTELGKEQQKFVDEFNKNIE